MIQLDCWLPEKEMFGIFSLESVSAEAGSLQAVVSNEVFRFTICFPAGVGAWQAMESTRSAKLLDALRADHAVLMRGNTFFKLEGSAFAAQFGQEGEVHYLIAAPNYVVEILSSAAPTVTLAQAKKN